MGYFYRGMETLVVEAGRGEALKYVNYFTNPLVNASCTKHSIISNITDKILLRFSTYDPETLDKCNVTFTAY